MSSKNKGRNLRLSVTWAKWRKPWYRSAKECEGTKYLYLCDK